MKVKCFDILDMVIQEATDRFSPVLVLNKNYYDVLKEYCSIIDSLSDEFDGIAYSVEVDEITGAISIELECGDVTIKNQNHIFYSIVRRTTSFGVASNPESEDLIVKFVFPSVWDKTAKI